MTPCERVDSLCVHHNHIDMNESRFLFKKGEGDAVIIPFNMSVDVRDAIKMNDLLNYIRGQKGLYYSIDLLKYRIKLSINLIPLKL